jgi:pyrimidine operon attenuation protein/uracil phosphoribosyltransferase
MTTLSLDAEALYAELRAGVRGLLAPDTALLGVWSGGAWLAERLAADLGLATRPVVISSTLHRDDFGARGLAGGTDPTRIPWAVDGAHILLLDDVLFTGRTIRAVLNELFDYGRPASVRLAVLVDRGGRELPIEASYAAAKLVLPAAQRLSLAREAGGGFTFSIRERG